MPRTFFALLILLTCCADDALARVRGKIEIGWDGTYRVSRWTPVFITLADDEAKPARNVIVEVLAPHDNSFAMRILQPFAITAEPATHTLYVPLTYALDETILIVKDAGNGRKLFESDFQNNPVSGQSQAGSAIVAQGRDDVVIGVSGRSQALGSIQGNWRWTDAEQPQQQNQPYVAQPTLRTGFLDERRLPDTIQGYDGLDVLVLNGADLANMRLERQQAIAQWLRGGGRLLLWPAAGPIPPDSPIAQLLPCRIGDADVINLTLADTRVIGLASRQEKIGGRKLDPLPHARTTRILNDKALACFGRAGLGEVGVLSIDAGQLIFESSEKPKDFWRPILRELVQPPSLQPRSNNYNYYNLSSEEQRRLVAMEAVVDQLGDVPGVGKFDFSYIAFVMIAMMVIVGPVDWFVLRKLGRQPWTWVTTTGWIVLITTGALYIGYVFRSGDLYYRTVRLVDQADDQVVGAMDVVGIYSPKTQRYSLEGPRNEWWEPANIEAVMPWRQQRAVKEITLVQDAVGNRLLPDRGMTINVWSLQFMEGELNDPLSEPPVLKADLRRIDEGNNNVRIVGRITNLSAVPLKDLWIRTQAGVANLAAPGAVTWSAEAKGTVAPNQTVTIDAPVQLADTLKPPENVAYNYYYYYGQHYQNPYAEGKDATLGLLKATCDLAAKRSERIERLLAGRKDLACIYATQDTPTPAVKLSHGNDEPPLEKHWQIVRALVELK
jgi:hypothetical protein